MLEEVPDRVQATLIPCVGQLRRQHRSNEIFGSRAGRANSQQPVGPPRGGIIMNEPWRPDARRQYRIECQSRRPKRPVYWALTFEAALVAEVPVPVLPLETLPDPVSPNAELFVPEGPVERPPPPPPPVLVKVW